MATQEEQRPIITKNGGFLQIKTTLLVPEEIMKKSN
jgi:hypothetical protein